MSFYVKTTFSRFRFSSLQIHTLQTFRPMQTSLNLKGTQLFIGGQWVAPRSNKWSDVFNPSTEQVLARVAEANAADVDAAVQAAKRCFDSAQWRGSSGADRAKLLRAIAKRMLEFKDRLVLIETTNMGKAYQESIWDIDDSAACFEYYAQLAEDLDKRQDRQLQVSNTTMSCRIRHQPVGVCAAVIPFNYPLLMATWKIAPALAAGCTVVVKPSEHTPLSLLEWAHVTRDLLPAGAVNVITGGGIGAGEALVNHPSVSKVAFTGSVTTGTRIAQACAGALRRCTLELGGKSALILFADWLNGVDAAAREERLRQAVEWIMFGCFLNGGQICSATTRLLVEESIANEVLTRLSQEAAKIHLGDTTVAEHRERQGMLGPLVCKSQYTKVMQHIATAKKEGAQLLVGGARPAKLSRGFFVAPTVFKVNAQHKLWKEEVFGPVLAAMTFKTEAEAIKLANDSQFGLGSAVISGDSERRQRVTRAFEAGIVWQNCSQPTLVEAPWGGVKKSGIGRELGTWGLENYLEVKQVSEYVSKDPFVWFVQPRAKL